MSFLVFYVEQPNTKIHIFKTNNYKNEAKAINQIEVN